MSSMAKSKMMSAKNAWGTSTGYADELVAKGMEQQKAQQLENWKNQQEVRCAIENWSVSSVSTSADYSVA